MSQFDSYSVSTIDGVLGHRFSTEIGGNILDSKFNVNHIDVPPAAIPSRIHGRRFSVGIGALLGHKFHSEIGGGNLSQKFFVVTPFTTIHFIAASNTGTTRFITRIFGVNKFDQGSPNEKVASHRFTVQAPVEILDLDLPYHFIGASRTGTTRFITNVFGVNKFRITSPNERVASHKFVVRRSIEALEPDYHFVGASRTGTTRFIIREFGVNKFRVTSPNEHVVSHKFIVRRSVQAVIPNYNFVAASETGELSVARIFGVNKFIPSPDLLGHKFDIPGIDVDHTKPQDLGQQFGHKFIVRGNFPGSQFGPQAWCMPPEFGVFTQESDWPTGEFNETEEDC